MRGCGICGKMLASNKALRTSKNMNRNSIWFMSLSLAGQMNKESARALADCISEGRPRVCHEHLVHAAQYILAEVVNAGKKISHYQDPTASGRTAYVTNGDIPESLVTAMNRMLEGSVYVTSRDVSKFLNLALKRYYSTALWPVAPKIDGEEVTEVDEDGEESASSSESVVSEDDVEKPCFVCAVNKDDLAVDASGSSSTSKLQKEAGHGPIKLKSCGICGKKLAVEEGKSASIVERQNMILLFSLSLAGQIHRQCARSLTKSLTKKVPPKICPVHIVQAAQYMLAELVMAGNKINHEGDPTVSKHTAYVTTADIPQDLISVFNKMAKGRVSIIAHDVSKFLNTAFRLYYSTPIWPVTEEVLDENMAQMDENGDETWSVPETPDPSIANEGLSCEGDSRGTTCPISVMTKDDLAPDDLAEYSSTSECSQQADQTALGKYFLVSGEMLMKLFRFCPQCGDKLNRARLLVVGTSAVVKFTCGRCCINPLHEVRWESQTRTVTHTKERSYKGNVAASIAAVKTGLSYVELERWAEQLRFALFSKCFEKLGENIPRTSV